ncbi:hypothetical protein VTK26DRAFT_7381 [Humicola hyalothermophila]
MEASANSKGHVALSLTVDQSSDSDILFPERRIVLDANNKSVTIGRASKVSAKGFIAGLNNGWFDSPVMSRQHAQIVADMDQKRVTIKDLGSLHGTYVNGSNNSISSKDFRELVDGDRIRFGVPVVRGMDGFHPTTVTVGIHFSDGDTVGTNTFRVPDGSDDEGDTSGDSDTEFRRRNQQTPTVLGRSSGNSLDIIDLTGANGIRTVNVASAKEGVHGSSETREVIDLSSPAQSPIRIEDEDEVNPEFGNALGHNDLVGDMDSCIGGDLPSLSRFESTPRPDLPSDEEEPAPYSDGNSTDTDSDSDSYPASEGSVNDLSLGEDSEMLSDYDENMEVSESEIDYSSDDDDYSINSARDDDSQDPWSNLLQCHETTDYPEIEAIVGSLTASPVPEPDARPSESACRSATSVTIEGLLNEDEPESPVLEAVKEAQVAPPLEPPVRDASPPKSFYTAPSYSFSAETTAEALGARTGKVEFFAAREENKLALNAQKAANSRPPSSVHALCNNESPAEHKFSHSGENVANPHDESFGLSSVSEHPTKDSTVQQRVASPPPDAPPQRPTPAATPADVCDSGPGLCSRRTHVGISDIVNQQTPEPRKQKRKAEDISNTTTEEELWAAELGAPRDWELLTSSFASAPEVDMAEPASSFRQLSPPPSAPSEPDSTAPAEHSLSEKDHATATTAVSLPERPAKRARLMRIAERVGFAALGGVTAGAMIVGTLIYTAPTFT